MTTYLQDFQSRLALGNELEQRVTEELTGRGWTAVSWGQGTWPEEIRYALKQTDSPIRWTPDIVAARGSSVAFIDCKNSHPVRDGNAHSVDKKCLRASREFAAMFDVPVFYVFDSLGVITPDQVMAFCNTRTVGNGPACFFINRVLPAPFDVVFGSPWAGESRELLAA